MGARIAIPVPTSTDTKYNERSLPPYLDALRAAGAEPEVIALDLSQEEVARRLENTDGVLLPGSGFDVDPERFGEARMAECGPADPGRAAVDELLLQDAFNLHKPVLGICQGVQMLNVWLGGTLVQDLNAVLHTPVNHRPGGGVAEAHPVAVQAGTKLAEINSQVIDNNIVNSSHHQALARVGDRLKVSAVSPADGVVEAVELDSAEHFVLGVQWHPERTCGTSALSRAIFAAFVEAAEGWQPRRVEESVAGPEKA